MNRREFLQLSGIVGGGFLLLGCSPKSVTEVPKNGTSNIPNPTKKPEITPEKAPLAPTKTPLSKESGPVLAIENEWQYLVNFDYDKFYSLMDQFNIPYPKEKTVDIVLTSENRAYQDNGETQSHIVMLSKDNSPDIIKISCGRYTQMVQQMTGDLPQTLQDELFMSQSLSESIINGLTDLSAAKGEITQEEARRLSDNFVNALLSKPITSIDLIFTYVIINSQEKKFEASSFSGRL